MKPSIKMINATALVIAGLFFTEAAFSYTYIECGENKIKWPEPTNSNHPSPSVQIEMRISQTFIQSSIDVIKRATDRWNATPVGIHFSVVTGDTLVMERNGQNEIWWTDGIEEGYSGQAFLRYDCEHMLEADIGFSSTAPLYRGEEKSEFKPYGGEFKSMTSTALHELGHTLGLSHTLDTYSLMGNNQRHLYTNGDYAKAYVGEDATKGALELYGSEYMYKNRDVAVSHWKHNLDDPDDGEYSNHTRTVVYDNNDNIVAKDSGSYKVKRGDTYKVEFTYENLSYYEVDVNVGFYISTNSNITKSDRLIKTHNGMNLALNKVYTRSISVRIPTDLDSNKVYYIGAIVDYDDQITQEVEGNNATYVGIKTD